MLGMAPSQVSGGMKRAVREAELPFIGMGGGGTRGYCDRIDQGRRMVFLTQAGDIFSIALLLERCLDRGREPAVFRRARTATGMAITTRSR